MADQVYLAQIINREHAELEEIMEDEKVYRFQVSIYNKGSMKRLMHKN